MCDIAPAQIARPRYAGRGVSDNQRRPMPTPPKHGAVNIAEASISVTDPSPIRATPHAPRIVGPIIQFHKSMVSMDKPILLLEYIKEYPESAPNCTPLASSLLMLFSSKRAPISARSYTCRAAGGSRTIRTGGDRGVKGSELTGPYRRSSSLALRWLRRNFIGPMYLRIAETARIARERSLYWG